MIVFPVTVAMGIDQSGIMLLVVVRSLVYYRQGYVRRKVEWSDARQERISQHAVKRLIKIVRRSHTQGHLANFGIHISAD